MELKGIKHYLRFCAVLCLAVFGLAAAEHHGVVKVGGVPIPGATVTAIQGDKKVVAVTDSTGAYSFADLADGVWNIQVEMLCFTTVTKEVGVAPNAPAAEWELKVLSLEDIKPSQQAPAPAGTAAPTAPATAAAPAAAQGSTAPTPSIVAANAAEAKPPAKAGKKGKGATTPGANQQGGFQRTDVNASGDGAASAAAAASAPGIAPADASQGASDAFVVNGSSSNGIERRAIGNARKGMGSMFNGGLSFQFDNSVLNARNYSLTGQDTPKTPYNHFTVGATVGGPLYIPHVLRWSGNFFVAYQTTRNRTASNSTALMPTDAERAGDFSQVTDSSGNPVKVLDPTSGQPIPGSIVPASRISPQAKYLLGLYPQPNFLNSGQAWNDQVSLISRTSVDAGQVRVNKNINNKNGVMTSFAYQNSRSQSPNIFTFLDANDSVGVQASASYRRTFTRQIYGTFGVQYSRQSMRATPYFVTNKTNVSGLAGITGNDQTPGDYGPPSLSFSSGIQGLSDGAESFNRNQTTAFSANMSWIRRPHNMTFGGDWRIQDFSVLGQNNGRGTFGFNGTAAGFDFAGFLLGIPDTSSIAFGNADKYLKAGSYDAFFTDDWRVSPSLTLNVGVRWEYGSPITEKYGRLVNLDVAPGFVSSAPVVANSPTGALTGMRYPNSLVNPDKHEVQPRASFAWKPIFGASTVVRGGYGVYYNTSVYRTLANSMIQQSPLSKSLSVENSSSDPLTLANGFIASTLTTTNTFALDPNYRVGYAQNWQLSVQQNVTASMVLTATYLGVKGTRATQAFLPNTYPAGAVNPCASCLPGYIYVTSNGNSTREAGRLDLRRRFHGGFSTSLSYTYSKALDDAALGGGAASLIAQNWLNLAADRGLSNTDQRHLLSIQMQYSTGVGVHGGALLSGWRGLIFKGWTVTSNISAGSGLPLSPVYSVPTQNTGVSGTIRPEYLGGDIYHAPAGRFLNAQAFGPPPPGQWGDAARNSIIGPNQFSMIASLLRSFADNIDVRFDGSNVLNHPTYSSWNTVWNSSQFGVANPPGAMRVVQATVRWRF